MERTAITENFRLYNEPTSLRKMAALHWHKVSADSLVENVGQHLWLKIVLWSASSQD